MASRYEPFVNEYIYHVFNKTIDNKDIFSNSKYAAEFYNRSIYYRSEKATRSFSQLSLIGKESVEKIRGEISLQKYFNVEIFNYVIMPNHFHLLVKQKKDNGISRFVSKVSNSLTRFYNLANKRKGQIFLKDFKAVRILSDEQLMHTARYIELNPFSAGIIKTLPDLQKYRWSSLGGYITGKEDTLVNKGVLLGMFNYKIARYKEFVFDRADYQRSLEPLKYAKN